MMSEPKQDKIPGYYTQSEYDAVRSAAFRWERDHKDLKAWADETIGKLNKDLAQALFFKADQVKQDEGEAVIRDKSMIDYFVMDAVKLKPRSIKIKWKGSTVVEIECRQDVDLNGDNHEVKK